MEKVITTSYIRDMQYFLADIDVVSPIMDLMSCDYRITPKELLMK